MRKFLIDDVIKVFEDKGCTLLSNVYVSSNSKLKYICKFHPDRVQLITFLDFKSRKYCCPYCSKKVKYTIKEAKEIFNSRGYELLETEYKNVNTKMKYICYKHKDKSLSISLHNLMNNKGCPYCGGNPRYLYEEVKEEFKLRGYELISKEYTDSHSKLDYVCPVHAEEINSISFTSLLNGNGCKYCGLRKGEKNGMWRGGVSTLNELLRGLISDWKSECLRQSNFRCELTGLKTNLVIHHLLPFHTIRDIVLNKLGIDIRGEISEYTEAEIKMISEEFVSEHRKHKGVVLNNIIHNMFHNEYGYNGTEEDFYVFKNKINLKRSDRYG
jgi:hypothetical protein